MLFFNAPSGIRDAKTLGWIVRAKFPTWSFSLLLFPRATSGFCLPLSRSATLVLSCSLGEKLQSISLFLPAVMRHLGVGANPISIPFLFSPISLFFPTPLASPLPVPSHGQPRVVALPIPCDSLLTFLPCDVSDMFHKRQKCLQKCPTALSFLCFCLEINKSVTCHVTICPTHD